MPFVVRFEQGSGVGKYTPPLSCISSEGGTRVLAVLLAATLMFGVTRRVFTPPLAKSKMAYDVMRRGETLLVTSLCLQRFRISQYNKRIYF